MMQEIQGDNCDNCNTQSLGGLELTRPSMQVEELPYTETRAGHPS